MTIRTFKFKLEPTKAQESALVEWCGSVRFVYNWFLALTQKRHHVVREGEPIKRDAMNSSALLTALKAEETWLNNVSRWTLSAAMKDVDRATQTVIRFRKKGRPAEFKFRNKYKDNSFRCVGTQCKVVGNTIKIATLGIVKFRDSRTKKWPPIFRICELTVKKQLRNWYVCVSIEYPKVIPDNNMPPLGVDRGIVQTLTFSDMSEPRRMPITEIRLLQIKAEKHQRAVSRRVKGSKRRRKAIELLAAVKAKIARVKTDWNHKQTKTISEKYGVVVLEDLKTSNMTRSAKGTIDSPGRNVAAKSGLNRSILEHNWFQFQTFLKYKLESNGGKLVLVNPAFTSQTCHACGHCEKDNRKSQAVFECQNCGQTSNADQNAALNILMAGTRPAALEAAKRCTA